MAIALAIKKIKICEFLLPPDFCVPPFGVAVNGHKPVGFWIGQWLQEHTADQAEHDRRSEERRVGKECRSRRLTQHYRKNGYRAGNQEKQEMRIYAPPSILCSTLPICCTRPEL